MPASTPAAKRKTRTSRQRDAAQVVACLRRLFQAVHQHSKAIQARVGLSGPQVWALRILLEYPGSSLGELAERMYSHPSTVCGIVDRLVARKVVRRTVDRRDRRGVNLSLTAAGRRMARESPLPVQEGLRLALDQMPARRLRGLRHSLEDLTRETATDRLEAPFFDFRP